MFSLTYVSSAVKPFSACELRALLEHCVAANRSRDVTGMLLYKDGNFMQVLEGDKTIVQDVHETILRDPRHRGLMTLLEEDVGSRAFSDWSMGFKHLGVDRDNTAGYTEFLTLPFTSPEFTANPSRARKLLLTFKRTMA